MLLLLLAQLLVGDAGINEDPSAATQRYALVIGANEGNPEEGTLQFATTDARNMATTLESVAGFARARMLVLGNPSASDVRAQFQNIKRMMEAESGGNKMLLVYYSGHADAISIHLGGTQLSWLELVRLTNGTHAGTRLLIADACRSGELTQVKGGVVDQPFALPGRNGSLPLGIALITSASAGETAQESPSFRGSFFTHHFLAALRGAADQNGDGQITLDEAFNYSSAQTLFDTAKTMTGAQHATYRIKMRGRGAFTLSFPKASTGLATLHIGDAGYYLLRGGKSDDTYVMELQVPEHGARNVWLAAGIYQVQRRADHVLYVGELKLPPGTLTTLRSDDLVSRRTLAYAGKGGAEVAPAIVHAGVFATAGTAQLTGQSVPLGAGISLSWRAYRRLWVEVLGEVRVAHGTSEPWAVQQFGVSAVAGLRVLMLEKSAFSVFGGARGGVAVLSQSYEGYPALAGRRQSVAGGEAFAALEWTVYEPFAVALEVGPRLEHPEVVKGNGQSSHQLRVSGYLRLGASVTF